MNMAENDIEYREITEVSDEAYRNFLYEKDGKYYAEQFLQRISWYFQYGKYKLITASINNKIVAHAGAFGVFAMIDGEKVEWWWGVDTFALPEARGKGIGKGLQQRLHDLPNFSSQAYSKINGNIKLKCGCKSLIDTHFVYYPCSRFFSAIAGMFAIKLFGRECALPSVMQGKYSMLNRSLKKSFNFNVKVFADRQPIEKYADFINCNLEKFDFYIQRTPEYLVWKYAENPSMDYVTMEIYGNTNASLLGLLIFSKVKERVVYMTKLRVSMVLDFVSADDTALDLKDAILLIESYCRQHGIAIDGVCALQKCHYYPRFSYPVKGRSLLSTFDTKGNPIQRPYISYSDQDMEQI